MRVGLVCPYSFDVPGGVQAHVADLARTLIGMGHQVSVLAPGDDSEGDVEFPDFVVPSGRSVPIPYNGSVARLSFGPVLVHQGPPLDPGRQVRRAARARTGGARACRSSR